MPVTQSKPRSPFQWFGGKYYLAKKLLPLVPGHRTYVEVFGGGASLLFAKPPSLVEVYNDLDSGLVNFFRVLRDPEKSVNLKELLELTPYSREEYIHCRETWEACDDDIERALRWFVVAKASFAGAFGSSWSFDITKSTRGMAGSSSRWLSAIEAIPLTHERIMRAQIEHDDFRKIIATYDTSETFFYLDPPYIPDTRRSGGYRHELTADNHRELVELLLGLQGKAMLSGYAHPIYEPLEAAGWQRRDFNVVCHAAGTTRTSGLQGEGNKLEQQSRVESVWLSPNCERRRTLFEEDTGQLPSPKGDGLSLAPLHVTPLEPQHPKSRLVGLSLESSEEFRPIPSS